MSLFITGAAPYGTFVYGTKVGESEEFSGILAAGEIAVFTSIKRWGAASAPIELNASESNGGPSDPGSAGAGGSAAGNGDGGA
jgi:hypothetical protein